MKDQIQQIFVSGLSLSLADGRLKVSGASETVETFRPLLKQYREEMMKFVYARSAIARFTLSGGVKIHTAHQEF